MKESEKDTYHILTQIWNLERWYWWTYLQGSSGYANIKSRLVDTERRRSEWVKVTQLCPTLCDLQSWTTRSMEFWRRGWDKLRGQHRNIYISLCETDSPRKFALWCRELNPGLCDNLEERDVQEGKDICIPMFDSC